MKRLEHIGIAVKNLEEANQLFARLLGKPHYKIEVVEAEGVRTSFFEVGNVKIELLEAIREDSPIARFIAKKGEGLHHLAFEVENIQQQITAAAENQFGLLHPTPKPGADHKMIAFLHPKTTGGVLVEMCEDQK